MPNILLSNDELIDNIEAEHETAGILADVPTTFVNSLVEPFKTAISLVNDQVFRLYSRYILELASGIDLDEKAVEFGAKRNENSFLYDDTVSNFNVFLIEGTASDYTLDTSAPLVIPKESLLIRDAENNEYILDEDIIIEPTAYSGYSPIVATTGTLTSVGVGEISSCDVMYDNIINLNPAKINDLAVGCRNNKAITTPTVARSDEDLRNLAFLRIGSMNNTNEDALRLTLAQYGITDVTFRRNMYGFGTIGVVVKVGGVTSLSDTTIDTLNNVIGNVCPTSRIVVPEVLVVQMSVVATFKNSAVMGTTKNDIADELTSYFSTLSPGEYIDTTDMEDIVRSLDNIEVFEIRCIKIDGRKCLVGRQRALSDQQFQLSEQDAIMYMS